MTVETNLESAHPPSESDMVESNGSLKGQHLRLVRHLTQFE